jgi:hypothetical protein
VVRQNRADFFNKIRNRRRRVAGIPPTPRPQVLAKEEPEAAEEEAGSVGAFGESDKTGVSGGTIRPRNESRLHTQTVKIFSYTVFFFSNNLDAFAFRMAQCALYARA